MSQKDVRRVQIAVHNLLSMQDHHPVGDPEESDHLLWAVRSEFSSV
jgi:hypothetical protein